MSFKSVLSLVLVLILAGSCMIQADETEQDIVNKYLAKAKKQHTKKLGWLSINYQYNRVNRGHNEYNHMANTLSTQVDGADFGAINNTNVFGVEFGTVFQKKFAWTVGGEFWQKAGDSNTGTFTYTPISGTPAQVVDPKSEVSVWGVSTGIQYYVKNNPQPASKLTKLAIRTGVNVGYYVATWDLFDQYENVNLTTGIDEGQNIAFKGTSLGFSFNVGVDYPINLWDMSLGVDANYLMLNFDNIAWYNAQDQEIIATWTGDDTGRVNLNLSGARAKVELKRFFSW